MTDYITTLIMFIDNGIHSENKHSESSMCTMYKTTKKIGKASPCAGIDCSECPFHTMKQLKEAKQQLEELQKIQKVTQLIGVSDG